MAWVTFTESVAGGGSTPMSHSSSKKPQDGEAKHWAKWWVYEGY